MKIDWKKILAVVGGLVILAGVAYLVSFLKPGVGSTDTQDWKTYRSEEYGFEIKHPQNYFVHSFKTDGPLTVSEFVVDGNSPESLKSPAAEFWPLGSFDIKVGESKIFDFMLANEKGSYSSICSEYSYQLGDSQCPYSYVQANSMVNGREVVVTNPIDLNELGGVVFGQGASFNERRVYYFKGKNYFYGIEESYLSSRKDNEGMLKTFKIIDR
ncbi:MAG: hypothetical protein AAB594_00605 [Patescibacteria group bacterium]